jgi:hypothetical protein
VGPSADDSQTGRLVRGGEVDPLRAAGLILTTFCTSCSSSRQPGARGTDPSSAPRDHGGVGTARGGRRLDLQPDGCQHGSRICSDSGRPDHLESPGDTVLPGSLHVYRPFRGKSGLRASEGRNGIEWHRTAASGLESGQVSGQVVRIGDGTISAYIRGATLSKRGADPLPRRPPSPACDEFGLSSHSHFWVSF